MQMRHPQKPRARSRQRPTVTPSVLNAAKRAEEPRARSTRASDPSRKIRTPVGDLKRSARAPKGQRAPASSDSDDGWEEEPTLVQQEKVVKRENLLKNVGPRPAAGGRPPAKSAPPVERRHRASTLPPHDVHTEETKRMPALEAAEARSHRSAPPPQSMVRKAGRRIEVVRFEDARQGRPASMQTIHAAADDGEEPIALQRRRSKNGEQRWLLLLKVGKEQLARVWNQGLASCEPIVWRPTTKAWAPLFDVPQIASFVTSIPPESVQMPGAGSAGAPDTVRSPPPSEVMSGAATSALDGLATERAPGPGLAPRSPHIPGPPRVPRRDTIKGPFGRLGEPMPEMRATGRRPRSTVRPPAPAASPTPALRQEQHERRRMETIETDRAPASQSVAPVTQKALLAPVMRPDSFAPQVHSVEAPAQRSSGVLIERAAWLMVGVVLALVLTLFPEATHQLRSQLARWIAPEPDTVAATPSTAAPGARSKGSSTGERESKQTERNAADKKPDTKPEVERAVAVEDLFAGSREDKKSGDSGAEVSAKKASKGEARAASASRAGAATARTPARSNNVSAREPNASDSKFDTGAARRALASAVQRAQFCAAERATGTVTVTFAPTGAVQSVGLANLVGNEVRKGCVVRAFRGSRIRPFSGSAVTVQKSFRLR